MFRRKAVRDKSAPRVPDLGAFDIVLPAEPDPSKIPDR